MENDQQRIQELEKRMQKSLAEIERLRNEISILPQPVFTSDIHMHIYDTCIQLGLKSCALFGLEMSFDPLNKLLLTHFIFSSFRMKRVRSDYYQWTLEKRRYL